MITEQEDSIGHLSATDKQKNHYVETYKIKFEDQYCVGGLNKMEVYGMLEH